MHWLHGYAHLLSALPEMVLAYDESELFNATGHMFFQQVRTPHAFLNEDVKVADFGVGVDVVDAIAFIHSLSLPLKEPQRMQRAHGHLLGMLEHSRKSWELILAETDDEVVDALLLMFDALLGKGEVNAATELSHRFPEGPFDNPQHTFLVGRALYEVGNLEGAVLEIGVFEVRVLEVRVLEIRVKVGAVSDFEFQIEAGIRDHLLHEGLDLLSGCRYAEPLSFHSVSCWASLATVRA